MRCLRLDTLLCRDLRCYCRWVPHCTPPRCSLPIYVVVYTHFTLILHVCFVRYAHLRVARCLYFAIWSSLPFDLVTFDFTHLRCCCDLSLRCCLLRLRTFDRSLVCCTLCTRCLISGSRSLHCVLLHVCDLYRFTALRVAAYTFTHLYASFLSLVHIFCYVAAHVYVTRVVYTRCAILFALRTLCDLRCVDLHVYAFVTHFALYTFTFADYVTTRGCGLARLRAYACWIAHRIAAARVTLRTYGYLPFAGCALPGLRLRCALHSRLDRGSRSLHTRVVPRTPLPAFARTRTRLVTPTRTTLDFTHCYTRCLIYVRIVAR